MSEAYSAGSVGAGPGRRKLPLARVCVWVGVIGLFGVVAFELMTRNHYLESLRNLESAISANRYSDRPGISLDEVENHIRGPVSRLEQEMNGDRKIIYSWLGAIGHYQLALPLEKSDRVTQVEIDSSGTAPGSRETPTTPVTDPPHGKGLVKSSDEVVALATYDVPEDGKSLGVPSLVREIIRQGFLIAAREELGLFTLDESLGDDVFETESPESFPFELRIEVQQRDAGPFQTLYNVTFSRPSNSRKPFHWSTRHIKFKESTDLESLVELVEELSRTEFVAALNEAGYARQVITAPEPVKLPAGFSEQMDMIAQFAVARNIHARLRGDKGSIELLGDLSRAYANLGHMTDFHWTATSKAFKARSLLYAQRQLVKRGVSGATLADRAYARAFTGRHMMALDDLRAAATAPQPSSPVWGDLIDAYCSYKPKRLEDVTGPHSELALYLRMRLSDPQGDEFDTIDAIKKFLQVNPASCWTADFLCELRSLGIQRMITEQGFDELWPEIYRKISQIPDLPSVVRLIAEEVSERTNRASPSGERGSRIELIRNLRRSSEGKQEQRDLNWRVLAELLNEVTFVQAWRTLNVEVNMLAVDSTQTQVEFYPLVAGHRFEQFLKSFSNDRGLNAQALTALVGTTVSPCRLELTTFPILNQIQRCMDLNNKLNEDFYERIHHRIVAHTDSIFDDLRQQPRSRREDRNTSSLLRQISPAHPVTIALSVREDWKQVSDQAPQWEEAYTDNPRVMKALAKAYSQHNLATEGIRCLRKVIEISPTIALYQELANKLKATGDLEGYRETLEQALQLPSLGLESAGIHSTLASYYLKKRDFGSARRHGDAAAQSGAAWALLLASRCAEAQEEWEVAEAYQQAVSERYESLAAKWYLWCVRTGRGDIDAAQLHARRFMRLADSPQDPNGRLDRVYYDIIQNELDSACSRLDGMSTYGGENVLLLMQSAVVADANGNTSRRDEIFSRIREEKGFRGFFPELVNLFCLALRDKEKVHWNPYSFEEICASVKAHEVTFLYYCAGTFLETHKEHKLAREYLQVVATAFDVNSGYCLLANHFLRSQNVPIGKSRMHDFPDEFAPLAESFQEADRERIQRHYDKALELMTDVVKRRPDFTAAILARGRIHEAMENHRAAIADFEEVLRYNPESSAALTELAWVLATSRQDAVRDGTRAVELAQQAMKIRAIPRWTSYKVLAAAYAECGEFDKAIETLGNWKLFLNEWPHWDNLNWGNFRAQIALYQEHKPYRYPPDQRGAGSSGRTP